MTYQVLSDGTRIYVDDSATGKETLFFSHGLLFDTELFAAQALAFSGEYRVIRYDHRGQGRSDESELRSIDMGTLTADAIELIEKLGVAPVHFLGLSMGGFVGMRVAARRPDLVRSLTLLDTSADPEVAENVGQYRAMSAFVRAFGARLLTRSLMKIMFGKTFLADATMSEERARWRQHLIDLRPSIWRATNGVIERESVLGELARIRVPTLVLVGEEDVATVPEKSERIHARIPGAKLVRIPRAGHSSTIEAPEAVNAAIREFLRGHREL